MHDNSELVRLRQRHNQLVRHRSANDPDVQKASRELREARLAEHIRTLVDAAPPLTQEQRDRLAGLLRPTVGGSAA